MQLLMSYTAGAGYMLTLAKMTQDEFPSYIDKVETNYAEELYSNQYMTLEAARERSRRQTREALAQGVETPGHLLFTVRDQETQQRVGIRLDRYLF